MAAFMKNNELYVWTSIEYEAVNCRTMLSVRAVLHTVLALCLVLLFGACSENQARKSPATSNQRAPVRAIVTVGMVTCTGKCTDGMSCHVQGRIFKIE